MSKEFWYSVAVSIPINIGAGLLVPYIVGWISRHGVRKKEREHEAEKEHFIEVLGLKAEPLSLTNLLIVYCLQVVASGIVIVAGAVVSSTGLMIYISHPSAL